MSDSFQDLADAFQGDFAELEKENERLLAENQQLADRAVCSGCGSDVDESGICHYQGCDDGQMIPASDLPGALREACDAQSEQWREHAEEVREMMAEIEEWRVLAARQLEEFTVTTQKYRAENQQLREALEKLAVDSPFGSWQRVLAVEALAGDAE